MTTRDLILEAAIELQKTHPGGFSSADIAEYLNKHHARTDGPWKHNHIVVSDFAIWANTGEITNPSTLDSGQYYQEKFLERVNEPDDGPHRYRLREN